jgi:hypothetical protein
MVIVSRWSKATSTPVEITALSSRDVQSHTVEALARGCFLGSNQLWGGSMGESVPVILLEKWINNLTSNLKHASEESKDYADSLLYQGMREGIGQVGCRLNTWRRHQKYAQTLNRLGRKFLVVRRVNLSGGRYRKLEWYEDDLFVTLAWRHARNAVRGELMLEMQHVQELTKTYLVYQGRLTFGDLVGLARESGLQAVRNERDWREWD